ncbi:hypothetical protein [Halobacillus massiliensis]|uniref:hypothetical protein n=1 Tax=Halobacillus massiliensis TaxID=1926286 RepID=UPI0009E5C2D3|nr:hypothetical protein [Halobacillus massiliensis]
MNFIVGFIIPWTIAILTCRRVPLLFLTVAPFTSLLSITLNQIGMEGELWTLHPQTAFLIFNSINIDFGYNPSAGLVFTYMIYYNKWKRWKVYLGFLLFLNVAEMTALVFDKVIYGASWNIYYTFLAYLFGLIVLDLYYHFINKAINVRTLM